MTCVGSYLCVVVVVMVVVSVEDQVCCTPLQTYCLMPSAMPSVPSPKRSNPYWSTQAKGLSTVSVTVTSMSSTMSLFASKKHVVESGISS